jgi:hypothetical protein
VHARPERRVVVLDLEVLGDFYDEGDVDGAGEEGYAGRGGGGWLVRVWEEKGGEGEREGGECTKGMTDTPGLLPAALGRWAGSAGWSCGGGSTPICRARPSTPRPSRASRR